MPGVVAFYSARDIPGANIWGSVVQDEKVFVDDEITSTGQMVGIVVADSQLHAQEATWKVVVETKDLPVVLTIEEAIAAESYLGDERKLERGDIEAGFAQADHIVEGISLGLSYINPRCKYRRNEVWWTGTLLPGDARVFGGTSGG